MKKTIASVAILLLCLSSFAEPYVNFSGHARYENEVPDFNLANSSLFTVLEGSFGKNFNYYVVNHWLSPEPELLYTTTFRSNSANWMDQCWISWNPWRLGVKFGKGFFVSQGIEGEKECWDLYTPFTTQLWDFFPCYQWGGELSYCTKSGMSLISAFASASPYGEMPFRSGLYAFGAKLNGKYGPVCVNWGCTWFQIELGKYTYLLTLGQSVNLGKVILEFDWFNKVGDMEKILLDGYTYRLEADWRTCPLLNVKLHGCCEDITDVRTGWSGGAALEFFPFTNSIGDDIRFHLLGGWNGIFESASLNIGVTMNFDFVKWQKTN